MGIEANSTNLEDRIAAFDPNDPAALEALERDLLGTILPMDSEVKPTSTSEQAVAGTAGTDDAKQDEKKDGATDAPAAGAPSGTDTPAKGVQARDGEHIIPYSVLQGERERASRAEAAVQALTQQLEQLQAGATKSGASGNDGAAQFSDEDLEQLDQDLPGVAKVIRAQMAAIERLTGTLTTIQTQQQAQADVSFRSEQDEIEAAIAATPALADWRNAAYREGNPDPLMWNRAADIDVMLREDPAFIDRPVSERFAKVVETMQALYGAQVPSGGQPTTTTTKPAADLKQVADATVKATPAAVPMSLSDIPGGAPPAQSDLELLENASAVALGNKFLSMTPEQQESYLARVGI